MLSLSPAPFAQTVTRRTYTWGAVFSDGRHGGLALQVLYTAHVGDSGAIIDRSGTAYRLTEDHKPYMKAERQRIQEAGGQLVENGNRVLSNAKEDGRASMLAMSR